jgi:Fe2+ or Zn2+ uptake regulation protein
MKDGIYVTVQKVTDEQIKELENGNKYDCTKCEHEDTAICDKCNSIDLFFDFKLSEKPSKFELKRGLN